MALNETTKGRAILSDVKYIDIYIGLISMLNSFFSSWLSLHGWIDLTSILVILRSCGSCCSYIAGDSDDNDSNIFQTIILKVYKNT